MSNDELVLLYQLDPATEKGLKVREILSRLNMCVKTIQPDMLSHTIGHLAGLPGHHPAEILFKVDPVPDEVMLMSNLSDSRIDRILKDFREGGVSRIALKAVVTPHNQNWTLIDLITELRSEHEIMTRYGQLNQTVQTGDQLLSHADENSTAAMVIALSAQGQELTTAITEARAILRAKEAPELPVIDAALVRLKTALDNFQN